MEEVGVIRYKTSTYLDRTPP